MTPHGTAKYIGDTSTIAHQSDITPASAEHAILSKLYERFLLILAAVAVVSCAVLLFIDMTRPYTLDFLKDNWGNLASVAGFLLSIYVLIVAKGARAAAREARLRSALQVLEAAADKCAQIGQFARQANWATTNLLATEVMSTCRSTLARWQNDTALKDSRTKLLQVVTLMRSIIDETDNPAPNQKTILNAQLDSDDRLAVVVGRMQGNEESGGN